MKNLFSYDSKFMSVLTVIGDTMLLNVLFLLFCVPVVTIGPAAVALFSACRAMAEDGFPFRTFFRSFVSSFRRAFPAWLIHLFGILVFGWCALVIWGNRALPQFQNFIPPFLVSTLALTMVLSVANMTALFYSRFECELGQLLKNGLFMTLGHLVRAVLMGLAMWAPVLMFFLLPDTFMQLAVAWVLFYFAAVASVCVRIMKKPFQTVAEQSQAKQDEPPEKEAE